MDSPDPPPAPDYTQTAEQQAVLNREALAQQNYANRPTQVTPWGRMDWTASQATDPATGAPVTAWEQRQTLTPDAQAALDAQVGLGAERSGLAGGMFGRVQDSMSAPLDYDQFRGVPEVEGAAGLRQRAEEQAYGRATGRLDPRFQQAEQQMEMNLRNKGLRPGDEAYDSAVANFERARTDAYAAAEQDATAAGRAESSLMFGQQQGQQAQAAALRQQEIQEALGRRAQPLEEINMLLAGQGVQPPSQPNVPYSSQAQPANLMGAQQAQYNAAQDAWSAQQAQRQGMFSGIMQGASLIPSMYGAGMFG